MGKKDKIGKKAELHKVLRECASAMGLPVFLNAVTLILSGTVGVTAADILGRFADAAFEQNLTLGMKNVMVLAVCIMLLVFAAPAIGMIADFVMLKAALRHDIVVFGHYLDKKPDRERLLNKGELQYELEDAPNTLRIQWVLLMSKAVSLPVCLGYLLYHAGKISIVLTLLMLLLTTIKLVIPVFFKEKLAEYDRKEKAYQAKRRDYETDVAAKAYLVRLWGIGQAVRERIDGLFQRYYRQSEARRIACRTLSEQLRELVNYLVLLLFLLLGAVMVAGGKTSPGELASMFVYLTMAQTFLNDVGSLISDYPLMRNAADRVCELYLDTETALGKPVTRFTSLAGEKVGFSYGEKCVFQDVDFSIHAGDKVAVLGENGRGKSTFIKILCSLLESYTGTIELNGGDFRDMNVEEWRKRIAYAPQDPYLFNATVRENVSMGNPEAAKKDVDSLMQDFGISALADRYVSMDADLSGGEKQKISLIRAFLKESELLMLDEPSNHLDRESVMVLKKYLLATDKTVILITHDSFLLEAMNGRVQV